MEKRLDYSKAAPGAVQVMYKLQKFAEDSTLEKSLLELVKTRVSQINGCAFCIDMHTKDARANGETEQRLYALSAWRETPFFTGRERAALGWAETVTLVSQTHVPDEEFAAVRVQFSEEEIVKLTMAIITINGWNRLAISFREIPGEYQPRALSQEKNHMSAPIRILGIAGSLRGQSYNRGALRAAIELVPEEATIEVFDLLGIPVFNQDDEPDPPEIVTDFKQKIRAADAVLFVTPEYNHSVPGGLKNAIDWASRPPRDSAWEGKPAAIMGASLGATATARSQNHLRQICASLNIYTVNQPEVLIGNAREKFDAEGNLTDETTKKYIRILLENLISWTRMIKNVPPH